MINTQQNHSSYINSCFPIFNDPNLSLTPSLCGKVFLLAQNSALLFPSFAKDAKGEFIKPQIGSSLTPEEAIDAYQNISPDLQEDSYFSLKSVVVLSSFVGRAALKLFIHIIVSPIGVLGNGSLYLYNKALYLGPHFGYGADRAALNIKIQNYADGFFTDLFFCAPVALIGLIPIAFQYLPQHTPNLLEAKVQLITYLILGAGVATLFAMGATTDFSTGLSLDLDNNAKNGFDSLKTIPKEHWLSLAMAAIFYRDFGLTSPTGSILSTEDVKKLIEQTEDSTKNATAGSKEEFANFQNFLISSITTECSSFKKSPVSDDSTFYKNFQADLKSLPKYGDTGHPDPQGIFSTTKDIRNFLIKTKNSSNTPLKIKKICIRLEKLFAAKDALACEYNSTHGRLLFNPSYFELSVCDTTNIRSISNNISFKQKDFQIAYYNFKKSILEPNSSIETPTYRTLKLVLHPDRLSLNTTTCSEEDLQEITALFHIMQTIYK